MRPSPLRCSVLVVAAMAITACAGQAVPVDAGGGSIVNPEVNDKFCRDMEPQGPQYKKGKYEVHVTITFAQWNVDNVVMLTVMSTMNYGGVILQARHNRQPCGRFNKPSTIEGKIYDCPPGEANTWYSVNITEPRMRSHAFWIPPMNYEGKNFTMHTTIIRDHKTYYQYVDVIPPRPVPTTLAPAPPTTASNQTTNETSTKT